MDGITEPDVLAINAGMKEFCCMFGTSDRSQFIHMWFNWAKDSGRVRAACEMRRCISYRAEQVRNFSSTSANMKTRGRIRLRRNMFLTPSEHNDRVYIDVLLSTIEKPKKLAIYFTSTSSILRTSDLMRWISKR